jgi:hypothetical protein
MRQGLTDRLTSRLVSNQRPNWIVILPVFFVLVSPVVAVAVFSYVRTYQELTDFTLSRRQAIAYLAATTLKEKLDRMTDLAVSLATRVRFRRLVREGAWQEAMDILQHVSKDFPVLDRVVLHDPTGTVMADIPALPGARGSNVASQDWYQGISRTGEPSVSAVYTRASGPPQNVITVVAPVKDETNTVRGTLALEVRPEALFRWIHQVEVGPAGFAFIVDDKGNVAAHPQYAPQSDLVNVAGVLLVQKVLRGEQGVERGFDPKGAEGHLAAYEPVPG